MVKSLVEVAIKFVLDVRWSKITIFYNGVHMAHLGILGEKVDDGNQLGLLADPGLNHGESDAGLTK